MRILVISKRPPWPLCYGDRLHCFGLVQRLADRHEICMLAEKPSADRDWPFRFQCKIATEHRHTVRRWASSDTVASRLDRYFGIDPEFAHQAATFARWWQPDVVLGMGYRSLAYLAGMKQLPTVCDLSDDAAYHHLLQAVRGRRSGRLQHLKAATMAAFYARRHLPKIDAVTFLSERDRRFCERYSRHPRTVTVPHGVDCEHYQPREDIAVDSRRIIFWGSQTFGPNITAVRFFAEKIWPAVIRRRPHLRWSVIGRGESTELNHIRDLPGIDWLGAVDDIRPHVAEAAIVVVPMRTGGGIKNKLLEAWAMGKCVLATSQAVGDLPGLHGDNVWIADRPRNIIRGLYTLLGNAALRRRLEHGARRTATEHCSWDEAVRQVETLCAEVTVNRSPATFNVELPPPGRQTLTNAGSPQERLPGSSTVVQAVSANAVSADGD